MMLEQSLRGTLELFKLRGRNLGVVSKFNRKSRISFVGGVLCGAAGCVESFRCGTISVWGLVRAHLGEILSPSLTLESHVQLELTAT